MRSSIREAEKSLFLEYDSVKKLQGLAKKPYDLTQPDAITVERIKELQLQGGGLKLLYATEKVDQDVMQALQALAEEASLIDKMEAMQRGEVINKIEGFESEENPALHTALRDLFDSPKNKEATERAEKEIAKLKNFLQESSSFTDLVMIGIGGSDLGPRAVTLALKSCHQEGKRVHFISNIDPDDLASTFKELPLKKSLVAIVSKSGTTLETCTNEAFARSFFEKEGIDTASHFIAITAKGSPMDNRESYREIFYIWDYIGGRFSLSSMVGGVPLAFAVGMANYEAFLKGCHEMDRIALNRDMKKNLPLTSALLGIWNRNFLDYQTVAILPYSYALSRFPAHIQQLTMESNGKRVDRWGNPLSFSTSPIIWGEPGSDAQHSFCQLIHQGTEIIPVEFIGFKETLSKQNFSYRGTNSQQKLNANLFAQSLALAIGKKSKNPNKTFPGNRPSQLLLADRLTPYTIGALLSYYEHRVAFQGFCWGINSFDQEGVQLGKVLANGIIEMYKKSEESDGECQLSRELMRQMEAL